MLEKGVLREHTIVKTLNNKRIKALPTAFKDVLQAIFIGIDLLAKVKCKKIKESCKPDIIIKIRGKVKFISLKSSKATVLHQERIETLIQFLRSEGISERTLKTIVFCHYGDGTYTGTGKKRYNFPYIHSLISDRIEDANKELNSNVTLLIKFFERVMVRGIDDKYPEADFFLVGEGERFAYASRYQIAKYLKARSDNWNHYDNLHIGPFLICVHSRYVDKPIRNEYHRNCCVIKWIHLKSDIAYIYRHYKDLKIELKRPICYY